MPEDTNEDAGLGEANEGFAGGFNEDPPAEGDQDDGGNKNEGEGSGDAAGSDDGSGEGSEAGDGAGEEGGDAGDGDGAGEDKGGKEGAGEAGSEEGSEEGKDGDGGESGEGEPGEGEDPDPDPGKRLKDYADAATADAEKKAGKDGVGEAPKESEESKVLREENERLKQELEEAKNKPAEEKPETFSQEDLELTEELLGRVEGEDARKKIKEFVKEYPEVAQIAALIGKSSKPKDVEKPAEGGDKNVAKLQDEVKVLRTELLSTRQQMEVQQLFDTISKDEVTLPDGTVVKGHRDARQVATSKGFEEWLANQPESIKKISHTGDVAGSIFILDAYKAVKAKGAKADARKAHKEKKDLHKGSLKKKGGGTRQDKEKDKPKGSFSEGFNDD